MPVHLSAHQAAAHCGVNEKTVRRWIKRGRLRADKRDGVYRVSLEDVADLCGQRRGLGGPGPPTGGQAAAPDIEPSGSGADTGPGDGANTPRPAGEAAELAGLVRELVADVRRLSEAATLWQARSEMLAAELAAARATIRALKAPRAEGVANATPDAGVPNGTPGETPADAPESHTAGAGTAARGGAVQEPTPAPAAPWWRRVWAALTGT